METYEEILRALGRIEGELVGIRKLSERVARLGISQAWLKGVWAVLVLPLAGSGQRVSLGPVLMALTRLEERALIEHWESDPVSEADDRSRRYFTITIIGERALAYAQETLRVLSGLLGGLA